MHDDVIKWKHFLRYWPFVRGIHRSRWIPHTKSVTRSFDVFFNLRLNKRLSKQPWGWWFETPSWSLWRQCNAVSRCNLPFCPSQNTDVNFPLFLTLLIKILHFHNIHYFSNKYMMPLIHHRFICWVDRGWFHDSKYNSAWISVKAKTCISHIPRGKIL